MSVKTKFVEIVTPSGSGDWRHNISPWRELFSPNFGQENWPKR